MRTFAMLFCVHWIVRCVPISHDSPPFGLTTVTEGGGSATMEKYALLTSLTELFEASLTRTKACVVGALGTTHEYGVALAGMLASIVVHVEPPLVEYSSLTLEMFDHVQEIDCVVPTIQLSPPFGLMTVTVAGGGAESVNTVTLVLVVATFPASVNFTRASVVGVLGTVQT
jgi:hypothetical protein